MHKKLLNPEQYAAATAGDGPLLVLAAAGTGKTQTLVYRVAYLVDKGVDPESILLLTFTNKAANEMLERAKGTVGPAVGDIWSGTFHHVCNRILRIHAPYLGYRSNFLIADRDDSRRMIDKAMKQVGVSGDKFPKREVLSSLFGNAANRGISLREVLEEKMPDMPFNFDTIEKVYDVYTSMKFDDGIMDFDDLLVKTYQLLKTQPDILEYLLKKINIPITTITPNNRLSNFLDFSNKVVKRNIFGFTKMYMVLKNMTKTLLLWIAMIL